MPATKRLKPGANSFQNNRKLVGGTRMTRSSIRPAAWTQVDDSKQNAAADENHVYRNLLSRFVTCRCRTVASVSFEALCKTQTVTGFVIGRGRRSRLTNVEFGSPMTVTARRSMPVSDGVSVFHRAWRMPRKCARPG